MRLKIVKASFWQLIKSVCAAFFGVQSKTNCQRDFSQPTFWPFLFIGLSLLALFVLLILALVKLVIAY